MTNMLHTYWTSVGRKKKAENTIIALIDEIHLNLRQE